MSVSVVLNPGRAVSASASDTKSVSFMFHHLSSTHTVGGNCNQQGKRGHYARARAHTLPNPEALGPEIEEGAVN